MSDKYYNWNDTLSKDALVTMVIGMRGYGKTYGLRKQFIKDFLKDGSRFCDISRTKAERKLVSKDYFSKLEQNKEFEGYIFKYQNNCAFIAKQPIDDEKPDWQLIGYFCALTEALVSKKITYVGVKRIVFDEALIDKEINPYARYLPNEFSILNNLIDSVTRENGAEKIVPRLYLLGNAVDMVNPYFMAYEIDKIPKYGYQWYDSKRFLLHYPKAEQTQIDNKINNTLSGYLASKTLQGKSAIYNEFNEKGTGLIKKKPSNAKFYWGYKYKSFTYGIWQSYDGIIYISKKLPNSNNNLIYSISKDDESVNLIMAKRNESRFLFLKDAFYNGLIRYENEQARNIFLEIMKIYGIM